MGDVQANAVQLISNRETSPGVAGSVWLDQEPNENGIDLGADIVTRARAPISKNRRRKKGATVGLSSGGSFDCDLTMELLREFGEAFFFASWVGPSSVYRPTAVVAGGSGGFTIPDNNQVAEYPANTLVYVSGTDVTADDGLHVVQSGSSDTLIRVNSLTAIASILDPQNATVMVCGRQFAAGDLDVSSAGNLVSAAVTMTGLGLHVGQWIWVGGDSAGTSFFNAENRGLARITAISATTISLAWKEQAFVTEDNSATNNATVQIFFGPFLRDVGVDDASYIERTYMFETTFENLSEDNPGDPMFEYCVGNYCNEWSFSMEVESFVACSLSFIGFDTEPPVEETDRDANATNSRRVVLDDPFNTSSDFARLKLAETDETGLQTDFESLTITLKNNVSPKKLLGTLGTAKVSIGRFMGDVTAKGIFNTSRIPEAIRNHETLALTFGLRNDDGAYVFDLPAITIAGGKRQYPANQLVTIDETIEANEDPALGFSLSLSLFPYQPAA